MYDFEINGIMKKYNNNIPSNIYLRICRTSPQISRIRYNTSDNDFEIWTDKSYWRFVVYRNDSQKDDFE